MKCCNILKAVVSEVKLRKNVSKKVWEARPRIFGSKYPNGSVRAWFPSSLVVKQRWGGTRAKMKEENNHQHFQCLQCIRVAIIKKPAMVT